MGFRMLQACNRSTFGQARGACFGSLILFTSACFPVARGPQSSQTDGNAPPPLPPQSSSPTPPFSHDPFSGGQRLVQHHQRGGGCQGELQGSTNGGVTKGHQGGVNDRLPQERNHGEREERDGKLGVGRLNHIPGPHSTSKESGCMSDASTLPSPEPLFRKPEPRGHRHRIA